MSVASIANGNFRLVNDQGALTITDTRTHTTMSIDSGDFESLLMALSVIGVNEVAQRTRPVQAKPRRRLV